MSFKLLNAQIFFIPMQWDAQLQMIYNSNSLAPFTVAYFKHRNSNNYFWKCLGYFLVTANIFVSRTVFVPVLAVGDWYSCTVSSLVFLLLTMKPFRPALSWTFSRIWKNFSAAELLFSQRAKVVLSSIKFKTNQHFMRSLKKILLTSHVTCWQHSFQRFFYRYIWEDPTCLSTPCFLIYA